MSRPTFLGGGAISFMEFSFFFSDLITHSLAQRYSGLRKKKGCRMIFSSYVGRTGHIPKKFRSAALSTATQPW
jgi:hypothetical protein